MRYLSRLERKQAIRGLQCKLKGFLSIAEVELSGKTGWLSLIGFYRSIQFRVKKLSEIRSLIFKSRAF